MRLICAESSHISSDKELICMIYFDRSNLQKVKFDLLTFSRKGTFELRKAIHVNRFNTVGKKCLYLYNLLAMTSTQVYQGRGSHFVMFEPRKEFLQFLNNFSNFFLIPHPDHY